MVVRIGGNMNNNIVDATYLALELTKLQCELSKPEDAVVLYKSILCDLLEIKKLPDVEALEIENAQLKDKLRDMQYYGLPSDKVEDLLEIIQENKGDMEPRVYNLLLDFIHLWYTV